MNISARNTFEGQVVAIRLGTINAEVEVALAGGQTLVAIVTADSVSRLGLKVGGTVTSVIKASDVLLATSA
ncbi:TOBE domain-containing protein [Aquabacterium sp.]|jgi:molybdate transport system regulatory protein|uniref:TOBE domain-containing protein n=1 Tax=Aquabacterium sp. TaxID=1872578 RepID=UPI0025B8F32D|nr:TOBE domain-containing protein [Aquabacterium sp.]